MGASALSSADLRLAAARAFIGLIRPEYRRIGLRAHGSEIRLTIMLDEDGDAFVEIAEEIEEAASEIAADFPDHHVRKDVVISTAPLPRAHIIEDGLIYQRWERSQ